MEAIGVFLDEEWESLSTMFSPEDSDMFLNFNSNIGENMYGTIVDESLLFSSDSTFYPYAFNCINSQESSDSNEIESFAVFDPNQGNNVETHHLINCVSNSKTFDQSVDNQITVPIFPDDLMEEILQLKAEKSNANAQPSVETYGVSSKEMHVTKRKYKKECKGSPDEHSTESPQKRLRLSKDGQKNKTTSQSSKNKKIAQNSNIVEEEILSLSNEGVNGQCPSSCNSESNDDSINAYNDSESKTSASDLNSNGKARASRGSATDPQSLYARRRRERINERLKILQNLVPNGTKVDISTMLEEAVHYVKFLQLQIKLLSSNDMWMYAPIAYNGMDMGLYQRIAPNHWPLK